MTVAVPRALGPASGPYVTFEAVDLKDLHSLLGGWPFAAPQRQGESRPVGTDEGDRSVASKFRTIGHNATMVRRVRTDASFLP